ncbi:unnamed protein product [Miscanthus lutarioriparius]|uniref:Uncharacterized protein n=1 Tax=Miscanthus lutarioriparius TaxID=422564 RepID=A0A811R8T1_9POAL|nr:unnamed protein product [Miscanthus lutarioriparius]
MGLLAGVGGGGGGRRALGHCRRRRLREALGDLVEDRDGHVVWPIRSWWCRGPAQLDAESYTLAASSAMSKVRNHTRTRRILAPWAGPWLPKHAVEPGLAAVGLPLPSKVHQPRPLPGRLRAFLKRARGFTTMAEEGEAGRQDQEYGWGG